MNLLIVLFTFFVSVQAIAQDQTFNIEVAEIINGHGEEVKIKQKSKYRWTTNADGARFLKWDILAETPFNFTANPAKTSTERAVIKTKGNKIKLTVETMSTLLEFQNGRQVQFYIVPELPFLVDDNCKKADVTLKADGSPAPFYLGISCVIVNDQVTFHLSFPTEVELSRSSIQETTGKGENFRVYDLKKITSAKGTLAQFEFTYKKKNYNYTLLSLKKRTTENQAADSRFTVAVGGGAMTLKSDSLDFKDTRAIAILALNPRRFAGNLAIGLGLENTLGSPDSAKPNSMSYFQVSGFLTYVTPIASWWQFEPRLFYVISNQSSGSGVGYQTGQFGAGMANQFQLTDRTYLQIEGMTEAISSPVINAHHFVELGLHYRDVSLPTGWTVAVRNQSYKISESNLNPRTYSQTFIVLKRSF